MAELSADYGEQTPQHFDRFGVRHHVRLDDGLRTRVFLDANPRGIVQRLGLTLSGWARRWPGMEVFALQVRGRDLEIRSYSDGRIKLFLDGEPVYTENTKVVTRQWVKHHEIERWYTPRVEQAEAEDERQTRLDAVRERLRTELVAPAGGEKESL